MPDHSIKYLHAVVHATRDQHGQPEYIAAVQDVTARRRSEQALDRARSELAYVARVMSLGALTASVAHEVSQPLSGIITNAGTCLRMLDADPPNVDGARETARRTIRDGHRAADVITRLRALFTRREFTFEPLELTDAVREVIALSANDFQRNRIVLQPELADDLPIITGDRVQLQQVILNLLRNAAEAMDDVHDRPRQLLIKTEREDGDRVRVTVRDVGVGLPPQSMDSLFDAFYTTKSEGMGIGLFVSRSIVEKHHGRLWAQSNDGPGATFSFSIPCIPDSTDAAHASPA
jgi:signal transduction histidine kinase